MAKSEVGRKEPASQATSTKASREFTRKEKDLVEKTLSDPTFPGLDQAFAIIERDTLEKVSVKGL